MSATFTKLTEAQIEGFNAQQAAAELQKRQAEMGSLLMGVESKGAQYRMSKSEAEEMRERNDELTILGKSSESKAETEKIYRENLAKIKGQKNWSADRRPGTGEPEGKQASGLLSLGKAFVQSKAWEQKGRDVDVEFEMKALFSTTAGHAPETTRSGLLINSIGFDTQPSVLDAIPSSPTDQAAYVFMKETVFTNTAAETAEAGAYPEATLTLAEESSPVRKLAVFLPVTDEQLEDVAGIESYIEGRLNRMLRQRAGSQILVGNGVAPNLLGTLSTGGIQTQALGGDQPEAMFYKAMTKVMVGGQATPNLISLHPERWQDIRLRTTTDGIYIWGSPSEAGPERMWGLAVTKEISLPNGLLATPGSRKGLVMDSSFLLWVVKAGITFNISNSHADYFVTGKQAIRAQIRAALPIFRPQAICEAAYN